MAQHANTFSLGYIYSITAAACQDEDSNLRLDKLNACYGRMIEARKER